MPKWIDLTELRYVDGHVEEYPVTVNVDLVMTLQRGPFCDEQATSVTGVGPRSFYVRENVAHIKGMSEK